MARAPPQIKIVLETIAEFQRILRGEKYITGSFTVPAVYKVRLSFVEVVQAEHTNPAVKALAQALLDDFDKR